MSQLQTSTAEKSNVAAELVIGGAAAMSASCITHPIDVLKVRMFLKGEEEAKRRSSKPMSRSLFVRNTIRSEGVRGMYAGLSAALLRQFTYSTARFGLYATAKNWLSSTHSQRVTPPLSLSKRMTAASIAGAGAAVLACPADMMLVRMQADKRLPESARRNYSNVVSGLTQVARQEGIRTWYRGLSALLTRGVAVTVAQFTTYELCKDFLARKHFFRDNSGPKTHLLSGAVAGCAAALVSTPIDLVKSRMMNSSSVKGDAATVVAYRSAWHCAVHTVRTEGFFGLYRGLVPCATRMVPQVILMWTFVEQYRAFWHRWTHRK